MKELSSAEIFAYLKKESMPERKLGKEWKTPREWATEWGTSDTTARRLITNKIKLFSMATDMRQTAIGAWKPCRVYKFKGKKPI